MSQHLDIDVQELLQFFYSAKMCVKDQGYFRSSWSYAFLWRVSSIVQLHT